VSTGIPDPEDLIGAYRLEREIGRGAMGVVYEATSLVAHGSAPAGRRVALKLLVFPPLLPEQERAALIVRFAREARALASVRHPYVVEVFDVGEFNGQPYLAMEYLAGSNARDRLLRHGPMPADAVVSLGAQLCEALAAVHAAGIVHRDIKPDNVVLEADGSIRLTDFGIARMEVEASLTRTGGLIGSPAYMAPEQILGGAVDARADLFSTGVTLYQMLTGELPFQGASIMEVAHRVAYDPPRPLIGVPPDLATVLFRAMEKDPDHRYPTALDLRAALTQCEPSAGTSRHGALPRALPDANAPHHQVPPTTILNRYQLDATPSAAASGTPPPLPAPSDPCIRHPGRPAVAHCAACDTSLCTRCVRHRRGRAWCPSHASPPAQPAWLTRLEVIGIGLLFALLLWSLYPLHW
jgi:eukaryotic-like serine/threonine-protein kinase